MKRRSSGASSRSTRRRPRVIDVGDPHVLLSYLDSLAREQGAQRSEIDAVKERLNEAVTALNRLIDSASGATAAVVQESAPSSPATEARPAAPSPAPAPGLNVRTMLPALLAKNPALQAKLAALGGCGVHSTFTMGCKDCQQGALARLASGVGLTG